jgi:hypothetical protein
MATWREFEADQPALAANVRARMDVRKHKTLATVRADGSPRISGIEAGDRLVVESWRPDRGLRTCELDRIAPRAIELFSSETSRPGRSDTLARVETRNVGR